MSSLRVLKVSLYGSCRIQIISKVIGIKQPSGETSLSFDYLHCPSHLLDGFAPLSRHQVDGLQATISLLQSLSQPWQTDYGGDEAWANLELAGSDFHFSFSSFCLLASAASSILLRSASWRRGMTLATVLGVDYLAAHGGELLLAHRPLPAAAELHLGVLNSPDNLKDILKFMGTLQVRTK